MVMVMMMVVAGAAHGQWLAQRIVGERGFQTAARFESEHQRTAVVQAAAPLRVGRIDAQWQRANAIDRCRMRSKDQLSPRRRCRRPSLPITLSFLDITDPAGRLFASCLFTTPCNIVALPGEVWAPQYRASRLLEKRELAPLARPCIPRSRVLLRKIPFGRSTHDEAHMQRRDASPSIWRPRLMALQCQLICLCRQPFIRIQCEPRQSIPGRHTVRYRRYVVA